MMGNKEKNFISVVIYVHNAQDWIEMFLRDIMQVIEEHFEHSEIICVDDFSDDNSNLIIEKVSKDISHTSISILHMSYFHGAEAAMSAGVDLAIGDFVLEFDSVMHNLNQEVVMQVYYKSLEGYDIVSASPKGPQKISTKIFYKLLNRASQFTYEIRTESFRILSRRVINRIGSMNKSVLYRKAVYANCGLPVFHLNYDVEETDRKKADGTEKQYRRNLAVDTLILFTQIGFKTALGITFFMMAVVLFVMIYSLIVYMVSTTVEGWTTTILFMAFGFLGLFGILTIIIKYLQIIVNLLFRKKYYSFEEIEKLTK